MTQNLRCFKGRKIENTHKNPHENMLDGLTMTHVETLVQRSAAWHCHKIVSKAFMWRCSATDTSATRESHPLTEGDRN